MPEGAQYIEVGQGQGPKKLSRREFLQLTGLVAVGALATACGPTGTTVEEAGGSTEAAATAQAMDRPPTKVSTATQEKILLPEERLEKRFQFDMPPNHVLIRIPTYGEPLGTLWGIAKAFNTDLESLKNLNGINQPAKELDKGQILLVPFNSENEKELDETARDCLIKKEDLQASEELIFLAARRPDLKPADDFSSKELQEINRFLRREAQPFLERLYGEGDISGVVWIRKASPQETERFQNKFKSSDTGGYVTAPKCIDSEKDLCLGEAIPVVILPSEDFQGYLQRCKFPEAFSIFREGLILHELSHIWLHLRPHDLGIFDSHSITDIINKEWIRKSKVLLDPRLRNLYQNACKTLEYRLFLRNPDFFLHFYQKLNLDQEIKGKKLSQISKPESRTIAQTVMPEFEQWWSQYHSVPEIPFQSAAGYSFEWPEVPSKDLISWYVPVNWVRPLKPDEGFISASVFPNEKGLYVSYGKLTKHTYPKTPDNRRAFPLGYRNDEGEYYPFFNIQAGLGDQTFPIGRWVKNN